MFRNNWIGIPNVIRGATSFHTLIQGSNDSFYYFYTRTLTGSWSERTELRSQSHQCYIRRCRDVRLQWKCFTTLWKLIMLLFQGYAIPDGIGEGVNRTIGGDK